MGVPVHDSIAVSRQCYAAIFMTDHAMVGSRNKCMDAGTNYHIATLFKLKQFRGLSKDGAATANDENKLAKMTGRVLI